MPKETIEFVIRPDGTVEETTRGLKGAACETATARLEASLGEILDRRATAERYEEPAGEGQTDRQAGA